MNQESPHLKEEITTSSEAEALAEIVSWSSNKPNWIKHALRILYLEGKLTDSDIQNLYTICKDNSTDFIPLMLSDIRDPSANLNVVTLSSIKNVKNINALAENQELPFSNEGITIIYGHNGTGKSGYSKILKSACRARGTKEDNEILQNIYATSTGEQSANISFKVGRNSINIDWVKDKSVDSRLSAISVFDSRAASVHIAGKNAVSYTPTPLKILSDLTQGAKQIRVLFDDYIKTIESQTPLTIKSPKLHPSTKSSIFFQQLSHKSTKNDIEDFLKFSPEELQRYEALKADLSGDRNYAAKQLTAQKNQIIYIIQQLSLLAEMTSTNNIVELQNLHAAYQAAKQASQAASSVLFSQEPLPNVGSEVWRTLWEAARSYSKVSVYPQEEFPVVEQGARCVLCQQLLDEQAASRLVSFEAFVRDESKAKETSSFLAYQKKKESILKSWLNSEDRKNIFNHLNTIFNDASISYSIRKEFLLLLLRVRSILRNEYFYDSEIEIESFNILNKNKNSLEDREKAIRENQESPQFKLLVNEYNELQDKSWLVSIKDELIAESERRKAIYELKEKQKETDFTTITNQSKKIAKSLVTDMLRAKFTKELEKLGVVNLAVEMQQDKGTEGIPYFRLALSRIPSKDVSKILSEGEHRCVALAAFLSELCTIDTKSAIVFDDPVSSLDHMYKDNVVNRLAEEAKERQIIVFTHDLPFMLSLKEQCKNMNVKSSFVTVTRTDNHTGICRAKEPFYAKSALSLVNDLRIELDKSRRFFIEGDERWYFESITIIKWLREAWEKAVEEVISPVLVRYKKDIYTSSLYKLTILTDEDCNEMREWYKKCSPEAHARPIPINEPSISPDEIENSLTGLEEWLTKIQKRQNELSQQRALAR
ncbi:MAG: AAA family ATPase [Deltaproteobacteria bacterium]|jgi:energy-coupling factor transporter ATP-binding protein EcfA2|nr:AAA family ATPase [Deltaproteobacteria bacterium]